MTEGKGWRVGMPAPESKFYRSQGLRLHYADWGNQDAPTLLLIHGGRDHCRNWDAVADHFRHDWHVVAPDLRGHGDSDHTMGGSYPILDFVYDIVRLVELLGKERISIVAHSMGGVVAVHFSALFPERVDRLVSIEGLGWNPKQLTDREGSPPDERMRDWLAGRYALSVRRPRRYATLDEAVGRMREENPQLSAIQARHLTVHGVKRNEDGSFSWKFDNAVRLPPYDQPSAAEIEWLRGRVACPTLLIQGLDSWASNPETDGRAAHFRDAKVVAFAKAGHWAHHDQFDGFIEATDRFLAARRTR